MNSLTCAASNPVVDSFAAVIGAAEEHHTSANYFWDNNQRDFEIDTLCLQRTLRGAAYYSDAHGRRLVKAGQIMLFTHREPTSYGYPKEATEPYSQRFLSLSIAPTLKPLFVQLRRKFDSVLPMPDQSESLALFNEVFTRYQQRTFRDRYHESELLHCLLIALYREQEQETHTSDPIEFGYHYLKNHFRSPVNLKCVADKCDISREHFTREFCRRFGEAPSTLLRRLRLEHADAMLAATRLGVEEVALASGFANANSFGRAYRLKFNRSPRAPR